MYLFTVYLRFGQRKKGRYIYNDGMNVIILKILFILKKDFEYIAFMLMLEISPSLHLFIHLLRYHTMPKTCNIYVVESVFRSDSDS